MAAPKPLRMYGRQRHLRDYPDVTDNEKTDPARNSLDCWAGASQACVASLLPALSPDPPSGPVFLSESRHTGQSGGFAPTCTAYFK